MAEISTISDLDQGYPPAERDLYWSLVHQAARVLSARSGREAEARDRVERYRELAGKANLGTQAQIYHNEPFTVAADLLDIDEATIDPDTWKRYQTLASEATASSPIVPFGA